jgi:hypothetical protein
MEYPPAKIANRVIDTTLAMVSANRPFSRLATDRRPFHSSRACRWTIFQLPSEFAQMWEQQATDEFKDALAGLLGTQITKKNTAPEVYKLIAKRKRELERKKKEALAA